MCSLKYTDLTAEERLYLCEEALLDILMGRHYPSTIKGIADHLEATRCAEIAKLFNDVRDVNLKKNLLDTQPDPWGDYA